MAWEQEFRAQLERGDPVGAVDVLLKRAPRRRAGSGVLGAHVARAAELVAEGATSLLVRRDWADRLLAQASSTHKTVGASLLPALWERYPGDVERDIVALAEGDDWVAREDGTAVLGAILDRHFADFLPRARAWAGGASSRVRRAVVVAARHAARRRDPARAEDLLDVVEPALRDPDEYVRKNVGPFAIGDGLLRSYPEPTLARLALWANDPDQNVRWNVAMAFAAAEGAKHVSRALATLAPLAADERRFVWRAVASALRNLARRRPKEVRDTLFAWREDPARRAAAETAIALAPAIRV